jgi:hypothetical protein
VRVGDDPDPEGHRWRRPSVRLVFNFDHSHYHSTVNLLRAATPPAAIASYLPSRAPNHSTFGLRSSCERAELMLALVTRVTPVSTLAGTGSPFEAASAVLTPS